MRITLVNGTQETVLCHGTEHRGEPGYFTGPVGDSDTTVAEWAAQVSRPIRALTARPLDRGNGLFAYSLSVERRFATEDDAHVFALTFGGTIPRFGSSLRLDEMSETQRVILNDAVLERLTVNRTGVSCEIRFEFRTAIPTTEVITP